MASVLALVEYDGLRLPGCSYWAILFPKLAPLLVESMDRVIAIVGAKARDKAILIPFWIYDWGLGE